MKDKVMHVEQASSRVISIKLVLAGRMINVISPYALQLGCDK